MRRRYDNFIFFSAGPVGDHVLLVDVANHFYKATGIKSLLILKHPNPFLNDLYLPYKENIEQFFFVGLRGVFRMILLSIKSILQKNVFVLFFPIPLPKYLKVFIFFIRFFTRSRVVGMNLDGTKSFAVGCGYSHYLGKKNTIPMLAEPFTVSANRFLELLGYEEINWTPKIDYLLQPKIFDKFNIKKGGYVAAHLVASHNFRSLPEDRWSKIIKGVLLARGDIKIIFSGAKSDKDFIEKCVDGIDKNRYELALGLKSQELLTLYANASMSVTVQTGNGLIINMLHIPTVVVNIKGTTMFDYSFNKKATILHSEKDCVCNLFETECNMIPYKTGEYMACVYNIPDRDIIDAVVKKLNSVKSL